jgi:hypothetical protein
VRGLFLISRQSDKNKKLRHGRSRGAEDDSMRLYYDRVVFFCMCKLESVKPKHAQVGVCLTLSKSLNSLKGRMSSSYKLTSRQADRQTQAPLEMLRL